MVVLDAVHQIQAEQANDLAVRWNCKAGKCGSCSAEVNGSPKLMCMTRLNELPLDKPVTVEPMRAFPPVATWSPTSPGTSGSRRTIKTFKPRAARRARRHLADGAGGRGPGAGVPEVHRVLPVPGRLPRAARSPDARASSSARASWCTSRRWRCTRSTSRTASPSSSDAHGIGYCNITKCCTKVCPEHITITDNAIIPLKERVVDEFYDPLGRLLKVFSRKEEA